jgi:hypothetical protein
MLEQTSGLAESSRICALTIRDIAGIGMIDLTGDRNNLNRGVGRS